MVGDINRIKDRDKGIQLPGGIVTMRSFIQPVTRIVIASFFVVVGVLHFLDPDPFLRIMPSALPWHLELVYISGFFEILGGVGLLVGFARKWAAWGLIALLAAVYPANINMLVNEIYLEGMSEDKWLLWGRMPLQFVLAFGVCWVGGIWPFGDDKESAA